MAFQSIAPNGAFPTAEQDTAMRGSAIPPRRRGRRTPQSVRGAEDHYLEAWQNVDSKHLSAVASAKTDGEDGRRPVARIEELFSRLDAGVAALRHAKAHLQRSRIRMRCRSGQSPRPPIRAIGEVMEMN